LKLLTSFFLFSLSPLAGWAQDAPFWKAYYDSTQLFWAKNWTRTVSLLEKAERSAHSELGIYHQNYLTILNDLGTAYWKSKDYPKAQKTLAETLELKSKVYPPNDKEILLSLSNLAGFYAEQGLWNQSKSLYKKILSIDPEEKITGDVYTGAVQNLVLLYDLNQQPDSAYQLLKQFEQWNLIETNSFADFQHQLYTGRINRKLQRYDQADWLLHNLVKRLSRRTEAELIDLFIQALQEQGILYLQTGAYSQAEKNLLSAYQLVTAETNRDHLLTELSNNLAQVYDKLNIYDKALQYYRESLSRCKLSYAENSLACVILLNNIAGIHLKKNNVEQAILDYEKVIVEFEKLLPSSDPLYITSLNNLATAYRKNNELALAREHLQRALRLLEKDGMQPDLLATVLNNIAVLNTAHGDYEQALVNYKSAYDIKRGIYGENSIMLMEAISNLAVTYWSLNKPTEAIPLFKKSMALATRQVTYIFPNLNENEQVQFYQKLKEDFERFNTIAIQWAEYDPELIAQMFQNRTIIKSLQFFTHERRKHLINVKQDGLLNELVSLLKEKRDELGHLYQLPLQDLREGNKDVVALEKEVDSLEKTISLRSSEALYVDGLTAEEVNWKALPIKLQPSEAIVEIVRFRKYDRQAANNNNFFGFADSVYYAALILTAETKERPELVVSNDGTNLETRFYYYYKNAMKYGIEDDVSFGFFWEPFRSALAGKTKIYFSADGVYHKINVNTLRDPQTKKYLIEEFDIVYLLNPIQFLENKAPLDEIARHAVLMGDPVFDVDLDAPRERTLSVSHFSGLPGTQQELRAIDKVLKEHSWKTSLYLKAAATESNLKAVQSPGILHLASHGFFSSDIVSLNAEAKKEFLFHSGIVLSGANKSLSNGSTSFENDGIVTAFEVMNLDLTNTGLVVLSACETGLGKIENGEGVFGLQRSFMQAGARNVLISLWKVDDEATRDLMIKFYEYLAQGNSLGSSLKMAQMDQVLVSSNPSLWGGFVLVGNN
jgi:tetratricopeptide (TPR) repeat protein